MIPIDAPTLLQYGIAVYVPAGCYTYEIEIFYSNTVNPRLKPSDRKRVWRNSATAGERGVLFLWKIDSPLRVGYYTIVLRGYGKASGEGTLSLAIFEPTDCWVVGLPYSLYPPIALQ